MSCCLLLAACSEPAAVPGAVPPEPVEMRGQALGTSYTVKLVPSAEPVDADALSAVVVAQLRAVDEWMSTYRDDSELSALNRTPVGTPIAVSPETLDLLRRSQEIGALTGGAFDVTVGPLVEAYGFGPTDVPLEPLAEEVVEALRLRVGDAHLRLDPIAGTATRTADLRVDLSAIAKGYAVDRIAEALEAAGIDRYMAEVGGEVRTAGDSPDDRAWRIGIERPDSRQGQVQKIIPLRGLSMATSGDYRNYREVDGQRITHIIDARTGRPVTHRTASVTVLDPSCARADALATALMVLGADDGLRLARDQELAALFLVRDGERGFTEVASPAFDRLIETGATSGGAS